MWTETSRDSLQDKVAEIRRSPSRRDELVALLSEGSAVYRGLTSGEVDRVRAFVLASFEDVGLPAEALPFVMEELEVGISPHTLAAAAKALRKAGHVSEETLALLTSAAVRCASNDDYVQFSTLDPGDMSAPRSSALAEIVRTIAMSGQRASGALDAVETAISRGGVAPEVAEEFQRGRAAYREAESATCCCASVGRAQQSTNSTTMCVNDVVLEDQSGGTFTYRDFFGARPSIVTFFYTRCMNPQKCSLTVTKLAALQRVLASKGILPRINVAAFSYDPEYDRAGRLTTYGRDRGFRFDDRNRFMRTLGSFEPIQTKFDLAVGYGPATVNRHSVDLFLLDAAGVAVREFRRVQWNEAEIVNAVKTVLA